MLKIPDIVFEGVMQFYVKISLHSNIDIMWNRILIFRWYIGNGKTIICRKNELKFFLQIIHQTDTVIVTHMTYTLTWKFLFQRLILDFRKISEHSNANAEDFISNPVNSFLLIKKLYSDLQEFINLVNNRDRLNGLNFAFKVKKKLFV